MSDSANNQGRTKTFFYNSAAQAVAQVVMLLVGFIVPRIMLEYYGSEINGLVSSITQFISYFNLLEAGLSSAAVFVLYKPIAENDHTLVSRIVCTARSLYIKAGWLFVACTVLLSFVFPLLVTVGGCSPLEVGLLCIILGTNGALDFFTLSKYRVVLTANQQLYVVSIGNIVYYVLNAVIVYAMAVSGFGIVAMRLAATLSIFARSVVLIAFCRRRYNWIDYSESVDNTLLSNRWDALYLQILGVVQSGMPIVILTLVLGDFYAISVYSIYNMIFAGVGAILGVFVNGLYTSFGDVIAKNEKSVLQNSFSIFEFAYYLIITAVIGIAAITLLPFIEVYTMGITDTEYYLPITAWLFCLSAYTSNAKTPGGMLVMSAGLFRETRVQCTIQALIIVLFGVPLTFFFGLNGMLVAVVLSNTYRTIDLSIFIPKHVTDLPISSTWKRLGLFGGLFLLVSAIPFFWTYHVQSYLEWGVSLIIVSVLVIGLTLLLGLALDRKVFKAAISKIKSVLGR